MGWKDKADLIVPGSRGAKLQTGSFIALVHEAFEKEGQAREQYVIHRFELLESSNKEFPVGCEASEVLRMDNRFPQYADEAVGQVKSFVAAVMGIEPRDTARVMTEITRQVIDGVYSSRNPARGSILGLKVYPRPKGPKSDPTKPPYMVHEWHPVIGPDGKPAFRPLPAMAPAVAQPAYQAQAPAQAAAFGNGWNPQAQAQAPVIPGSVPTIPGQAPAIPQAAPFPPPGWTLHPDTSAGVWYYKGQTILKEADLRILVSQGKA